MQDLFDNRHGQLTASELEAIQRHIERCRCEPGLSMSDGRGGYAARPPRPIDNIERYDANMMRSILLSSSYPDNIRQIVQADQRLLQYEVEIRPF